MRKVKEEEERRVVKRKGGWFSEGRGERGKEPRG